MLLGAKVLLQQIHVLSCVDVLLLGITSRFLSKSYCAKDSVLHPRNCKIHNKTAIFLKTFIGPARHWAKSFWWMQNAWVDQHAYQTQQKHVFAITLHIRWKALYLTRQQPSNRRNELHMQSCPCVQQRPGQEPVYRVYPHHSWKKNW